MPRDSFEKFCREIVKRYRKSPHYNSLTEKNHSFARGLRRLFHNLEAKNFDLRSTFGLPPGIGSVRPAGRFLSTDFPDFHHAAIGGKPEEYSGLRSISHSEYDQFLEQQIEAYVDADFDYLHRGVGHAVIGTLLSGSYECPAEPSSESTSQACPAVLAGLEKPDSWEQVTILPFTGHNDAVRISVGNAKPIVISSDQLTFKSKRNANPIKAWKILLRILEEGALFYCSPSARMRSSQNRFNSGEESERPELDIEDVADGQQYNYPSLKDDEKKHKQIIKKKLQSFFTLRQDPLNLSSNAGDGSHGSKSESSPFYLSAYRQAHRIVANTCIFPLIKVSRRA